MTEEKKRIASLITTLQQARDELALQIHLGGKEAKDEWERLEKKLDVVKQKARPYTEVIGETGGQVGSALELAVDELHKGYSKIRKLISS